MARSLLTPHILIVDDDPDVRATLRAALSPEGFHISEAADGDEMKAAIEVQDAMGGGDEIGLSPLF
jgi:DNA-binding response OmpR family regulator